MECLHTNVIEDAGDRICTECGSLLENIDFRAEWKSYTDTQNSRCQYVGSASGKIGVKDVLSKVQVELSPFQKDEIEENYKKIVSEKILRGNTKKAIIAACTLFCLRKNGKNTSQEEIRKLFEIDKKQMLEGITCHTKVFPESRVQTVNKENSIAEIVEKVNSHFSEKLEYSKIFQIFQKMCKKDRNFKHSSAKQCASVIIFYELNKRKKVVKSEYCNLLGISECSMNKLYKIISS